MVIFRLSSDSAYIANAWSQEPDTPVALSLHPLRSDNTQCTKKANKPTRPNPMRKNATQRNQVKYYAIQCKQASKQALLASVACFA